VGEPTNPHYLGEMIKIGRRGILDGDLTVRGTAGHVAYPEFAQNPINLLVDVCTALKNSPLDEGFPEFQPSHLEITSIDVDNAAGNVIPEKATAHINVRFNPNFSGETLKNHLKNLIETSISGSHAKWELECDVGGEAFLTECDFLKEITKNAIEKITGIEPEFSTTGGTSDARFIKDLCPVVEFGLLSGQAHKIDEHINIRDIEILTNIYSEILSSYCQLTKITN
jgi:succinyl-diaminopimelate desuccinylase